MQLSAGFVSLSVALAGAVSMVSAAPIKTEAVLLRTLAVVPGSDIQVNPTIGAAYFMTNEPDGNLIMAAEIAQDGTLRLNRAVSTAGRGSHGKSDPDNGPDALFSQGSIKASINGKMLFAVNAGSNTVSAFSIDPNDPANIQMVGGPVSSGGEFPISLAVNKAGNRVCVLNGGAVANVNCYSVDNNLGLTAIPGSLRSFVLNQTTPPKGPANTASHILFNEAEDRLLASMKGTPNAAQGVLAMWQVEQNGTLSENFAKILPGDGGNLQFGMSIIPGKNAVLVTDPAIGFDVLDLNNVKITDSLRAPGNSSVNKIDGQVAACWAVRSGKTGNFYVTDIGTSKLTEINVDGNLKASVVKQYDQKANSATIDLDVATVGNNDFLYILAPNTTEVQVVKLNGAGNAQTVQNLALADLAKQAGVRIGNNTQGMTTFIKQ